MADIKIKVDHILTKDEAVLRIEQLFVGASPDMKMLEDVKYVLKETQFAFSGKAKGIKVSGKLAVFESSVKIIVALPWAARPFRKTAESAIHSGLKKALS